MNIRHIKQKLKSRTADALLGAVVYLNRDSNYIKHLRREVPEWFSQDGPNKWLAESTEQLLAVLSHEGHSGGSIGFALKFFDTMARFKPWGPLTGDDDEWVEIGDNYYQNRRCHSVFKKDGSAYNINGRVFHDGDGICCTNIHSHTPVTFPYAVPDSPEVIDRSKDQTWT